MSFLFNIEHRMSNNLISLFDLIYIVANIITSNKNSDDKCHRCFIEITKIVKLLLFFTGFLLCLT